MTEILTINYSLFPLTSHAKKSLRNEIKIKNYDNLESSTQFTVIHKIAIFTGSKCNNWNSYSLQDIQIICEINAQKKEFSTPNLKHKCITQVYCDTYVS